MSGRYILDTDGNPIHTPDLMTWARWMKDADRHVAQDEIGNVRISTVFLGLDHSWGGGAPILFETMIFGGKHDQWQERWQTRDAALAGHRLAVNLVRETAPTKS